MSGFSITTAARIGSAAATVLCLVCMVSPSWSHGPADSRAGNLSEQIGAGDVHELCLVLGPGESLDYALTATQPLDFNIHYHVGSEVFYPLPERKTAGMDDTFVAESEQEYCLMWTNRTARPVTLSAEYAIAHP